MKQVKIKAFNQKHAIEIAKEEYNIDVQYDATRMWRRQNSPLEGFPFVRLCLNALDNRTDRKINTGIIINLDLKKGGAYQRNKKIKIDRCVHLRGRLRTQLKRVTEVYDTVTKEIVCECNSKIEAVKRARSHAAKTGHSTYGIAKFVVKNPEDAVIFKVELEESVKGTLKNYLVVVLDQISDVNVNHKWHENKT